jgi:hypothetical protein
MNPVNETETPPSVETDDGESILSLLAELAAMAKARGEA